MMYSAGTSQRGSTLCIYTAYRTLYLLCSLQDGQSELTVKINQWTEVSTLMQLDSEDTEVSSSLWIAKYQFNSNYFFLDQKGKDKCEVSRAMLQKCTVKSVASSLGMWFNFLNQYGCSNVHSMTHVLFALSHANLSLKFTGS